MGKKDMEAAASAKTPLPQSPQTPQRPQVPQSLQSPGHGTREEMMVVGGVSVDSVAWSQETRVALMAVSAMLMSVGVCFYKSNASGKKAQYEEDAAYGTV